MKFRKKPVVIEAEEFTEENKDRCFNFVRCNCVADRDENGVPTLRIQTLEGEMTASLGDWIIRGVKGEFYPCRPEIFAATYEPVEDIANAHPHGRAPARTVQGVVGSLEVDHAND